MKNNENREIFLAICYITKQIMLMKFNVSIQSISNYIIIYKHIIEWLNIERIYLTNFLKNI